MDEVARLDANRQKVMIGTTDSDEIRKVAVDDNGRLLLSAGLGLPVYDYISVAYPVNTTEVYSFYVGGSGGTLVSTITVVYTTATKDVLSTVTKT